MCFAKVPVSIRSVAIEGARHSLAFGSTAALDPERPGAWIPGVHVRKLTRCQPFAPKAELADGARVALP
jgi:hypothetical protein